MAKDVKDLLVDRITQDRDRLLKVCTKLVNIVEEDSDKSVFVAEMLSKVTDSLTKQNAQLLELIKIKQKQNDDSESEDSGFSKEETSEMFNSMEQ